MRAITKLLGAAAAVALTAGVATSANAAVWIGTSIGAGPITTQVAGDPGFASWAGAFGGFEVNTVQGVEGAPTPALLSSGSIDVNNAGGTSGVLNVFVTTTNVAAPLAFRFIDGFTSNILTAGWSVTESVYIDPTNGVFGGNLLGSHTFNAIGSVTQLDFGAAGPGPYSITHKYTITAAGTGRANSTIDTTAAVPEPGTWALMIMGFGAAGAMLRTRRRQAAFA